MNQQYLDALKDLGLTLTVEQAICAMDHIFGNVFVVDREGRLIFISESSAASLGVPRTELIGVHAQDLLDAGITTRSTTLEAIEKKQTIVGLAHTGAELELFTTSTPVLGENGEVEMVVTYSQESSLMDIFIENMEKERQQTIVYRHALEYLVGSGGQKNPIITNNPEMIQIFKLINVVAATDSTIVIGGESGTGKDVLARYIHQKSPRACEPFIPVNCSAIPRELIESEFFGYKKGAFTGASAEGKPGLFELADNGTLFLDEIGELPLDLQSKLLRVLETGEVTRLGGVHSKTTNVRLVAATNRNLKKMVQEKQFREDLYYRLNVIPVTLPPLRERIEDIELLANTFLEQYNAKYSFKKRFSKHIIHAFQSYGWPGNIRELRNVVERMVITSTSDLLTATSIQEIDLLLNEGGEYREARQGGYRGKLKDVLKIVEDEYIAFVLDECDGRVAQAASRLGIHRSLLYKKLKGIKKPCGPL